MGLRYSPPSEGSFRCVGAFSIHLRLIPQFLDDGTSNSTGIERFIGRRPILAIGNSDGDYEMLEWVGTGSRLAMLLHHDDAQREWAYDRHVRMGKLSRALDAAPRMGWQLISMTSDWVAIFAERLPGITAQSTR